MSKKNFVEDIYPLSPLQQGLLFHTVYDPAPGVYIVQTTCTLQGDLGCSAFKRAWQRVIDRHTVLRTAFVWERRDEPFQVVYRQVSLPWEQHDWCDLSPLEQRERLEALIQTDCKRGFSLSKAPLMRFTLIQLAEDSYQFIWSHHHLLLDGWSLALILKEVFVFYQAFHRDQDVYLERPRPYGDYIAWLQEQDLSSAESFWRRMLKGFSTPTGLGVEHIPSGSSAQHDGYAGQRSRLATETTTALQSLARQQLLTLNTLVQGAWALLLSRYSGDDDVLFGATVSGRPVGLAGNEAMVGLFINTLPNRVRVPPTAPLLAWLKDLQAQQVELRQYEYSSLVQVQSWSDVPGGLPLFESIIVFENYPMDLAAAQLSDLASLVIRDVQSTEYTNYPITLGVAPGPNLILKISYDRRRFDAPTIDRLLGHLQVLLEGMAAQPEQRLMDLPLLTAAEQHQLLVEWNSTHHLLKSQTSGACCVHELFEAQAARTPEAVALVFDRGQGSGVRGQGSGVRGQGATPLPLPAGGGIEGGVETRPAPSGNEGRQGDKAHPPSPNTQHLTYGELNARANRLAHYLQQHGVAPEVPVGLCLDRSIELVIALLGTLKAGGVYLPLDPAYPAARLNFMLADTQAPLLLTTTDQRMDTIYRAPTTDHRPLTTDVRPQSKIQNPKSKIVHLDADWPTIAQQPTTPPRSRVQPAHLAYLIYTSGSTGRPKAVMVEHQSIVNTLHATQARFDLRAGDRMLCLASFAFDIALFECLSPLIVGGTSLLLGEHEVRELPKLTRMLSLVSVVHMIPSLMQQVVRFIQERNLHDPAPGLRTILIGGDAVSTELVQQVAALFPATQLYLCYGPTEGAILSTTHLVSRDQDVAGNQIGRPLPNMWICLYDQQRQLVPVGVVGELYIGGAGVTRGYLNRPDLTAERFVPNPFTGGMGDGGWGMEDATPIPRHPPPVTRLYRTGDLARYLADGSLEFVGRRDQQVKVRGYRVELGEVEAQLGRHAAVQECVVLARADAAGEQSLVAYVVPKIEDRGLKIEDSNIDTPETLSSIFYPLSSDIRGFLQERLPAYMLPAAFVVLSALPLTVNGKVDRGALLGLEPDVVAAGEEEQAPRNEVEELLAALWGEVLGRARLGREADFFALGGHSLLAMRLVARVRELLGVELAVRELFAEPTVAGLARRVSSLQRVGVRGEVPPLERVAREGALPLSFAQLRLWFLDQFAPNSPVYTIPTAVRLLGQLDAAALQQSLHVLVRRHEILSTTFAMVDGQPVQVIGPPHPPRVPLLDLQTLSSAGREAIASRLAQAGISQPFDLARGPLLRVALLRLDPQEHVLLLYMHHIITDGWSMSLFIRELTALYAAATAGRTVQLPPLPIQYADYALWQRAWLQGAVLEAQLAYWREQLAALPVLELPTDHPRPAVATFGGAIQPFVLPAARRVELERVSRQAGVTLFMTLLAAFQVLLSRYSGQEDIVVGVPSANRSHAVIEHLIGFFVNTLVLRGNLSGNPSFSVLLEQVRAVCLGAYAHQEVPFEQVVEALAPQRDLSRHPLVQVFFVLQNAPTATIELPGLRLCPFAIERQITQFDLSLWLTEAGEELAGMVEYRTDLFDAPTITRLHGHFQTLLAAIAADSERRMADLPLLTAAERRQLLHEWNATQAAYPRNRWPHLAFEEQAARRPDAVAVVFGRGQGSGVRGQRDTQIRRHADTETEDRGSKIEDRGSKIEDRRSRIFDPPSSILHPPSPITQHPPPTTHHPPPTTHHLTYCELNARANKLARFLQQRGVGPEGLVAICMERSPELVVALLAVFKAGGGYVPLDPSYPCERLAFMLADSQAPILVTLQRLAERLPAHTVPTVFLDTDWYHIAQMSDANLVSRITAAATAYLIYTSGTTGRPKAVMVEYGNLVNTLFASQAIYQFTARDRIPYLLSFAFDIALFQLLSSLLVGGTSILLTEQQTLDLPRLLDILPDLTFLHATPSLLRQIVSFIRTSGPHHGYANMRKLAVGGDTVPLSLISEIQTVFPSAQVHIGYGPTEGTIMCTNYIVPRDRPLHGHIIGRPMQNMFVRLYDRNQNLVPIGVVGELYIGGAGVTRGYLNRPDLTAERFVPNPFTGGMGDGGWGMEDATPIPHPPSPIPRLYKTGDLARYLADGGLEFVGRRDQQVKVRGYRVELGEVEAQLGRHAAVQECVVLARADAAGEQSLVAYVVPKIEDRGLKIEDSNIDTPETLSSIFYPLSSDIRGFLQERLPAYMLPAAFVVLSALPLTVNGKVDRGALLGLEPDVVAAGEEEQAPRNEVEELLAALWGEVLGRARLGREADFFALGGHSLLAMRLVARVRELLGVELAVRELFAEPTVAGLARRVSSLQRVGVRGEVPPLERVAREGALPLSFAQLRLWFLDQLQPGSPAYNLSTALRLSGPLDIAAFSQSLTAIVRRHEVLRTTFALVDGRPVQIIGVARRVPTPLLDLQGLAADERLGAAQRLARFEARSPFDLAGGPLLRVVLLRLSDDEHIMLLTLHHIAADGWSASIFIRELAVLYTAYATGQPIVLPDLPIQYADYALWQRAWLQGAVLEAQLAYWREQLAVLPVLDLPTDYQRPSFETFEGATAGFLLPAPLHKELLALSRRAGVTLFMTLLAAFQVLLSRYSGQEDIVVGVPSANRSHAVIEHLIGFFVNTLVLRGDLSGNPSFSALLEQVRAVCLGAYAHQEVPFEQVVEALAPQRDLSRHPLFQVMFALQNTPVTDVTLPGLTLHPLTVEHQTAKFDLSLSLMETDEGLSGALEYRTSLFDAPTIARLHGHFQTLLAAIAADPERRMADLPLLTAAERRQLLEDWNTTLAAYPRESCIHVLFEIQAAYTPDAVALVFDRGQGSGVRGQRDTETEDRRSKIEDRGSTIFHPPSSILDSPSPIPHHLAPATHHPPPTTHHLSYHELNARANQLARYLKRHGVGPEVLVGLCLERSLELVIGLLGVLKASGAYLPLDPAYPTERLALMLADAQAPVLLTQRHLEARLPPLVIQNPKPALSAANGSKIQNSVGVCLDAHWGVIAQQSRHNPPNQALAENLAYVMYTSGSTGRPKGVSIIHRSVVRLVQATNYVTLTADDVLLQLAPISFDAATFEIWGSLLNGARLAVVSDQLPSLHELGQALERLQITTLWLTAGLFHRMVEDQLDQLRGVRHLLAGGDVLSAPHVRRALQELGGCTLINGYGPTENTTFTCCYPMTKAQQVREYVSIGRPIANTQVYVLDNHLQPTPIGVPGELCAGGDGLARCYQGQPDLTAERFVPNPFAQVLGDGCWVLEDSTSNTQHPTPNTRLYRTGDLVRYRLDGTIEFLGRRDEQVKVRGYRIELGEVELALGQHPGVRECVVVAREDRPNEKRLVAYIVTSNKSQVTSSAEESLVTRHSSLVTELRDFLHVKLPGYMVPSAFVLLEEIPLTANGKVDRRALPAPESPQPSQDDGFVAARSATEALLARIWADVLGLEQVGVHDNFFTLGGDSILSIQIVARAHQAGLQITPKQLFQHQTIAELVEVVDTTPVAAAEQGPVEGPLPLTPIQHWFFAQDLPEPHHFNQALLLILRQPMQVALLEEALRHLLRHHDALRLRFVCAETGWQQHNTARETHSVVVYVDFAALPAAEQGCAMTAVAADLQKSLNLTAGPLLRVAFFDCGPDRPGRLLLIIHHLVVDGVSWRILLDDLQTLYTQLRQGVRATLPLKTTSFKQWAEQLAAYAGSEALRSELEYWLATLNDEIGRPPVDYTQGANTVASTRNVAIALDAEETRALLHEVPAAYQTQIGDVLLTALAQAWATWTGRQVLLVDLEGHGREALFEDVDLSRTVGWYTTLFPVLLDLRQAVGPGAALKAVKEQLRVVPQRGIGYGVLRYLSKDKAVVAQLQARPAAQVSFNYLGQTDQVVAGSELFSAAPEPIGSFQCERGMRSHLLGINGVVAGGQLRISWSYSEQIHRRATIERLAQAFLAALRALIAHCRAPDAGGYTPSDFPEATLSQKELDKLLARVGQATRRQSR